MNLFNRRRVVFLSMFVLVSTSVAACLARQSILPPLGGSIEGARAERIRTLPMYRDGVLRNELELHESLGAVLDAIGGERPEAARPETMLSFPGDAIPPDIDELAVSWLGHSTVVLDIDGVRLLFDPMFSHRASPVDWAGPDRYLSPPLQPDEIPAVDAVLISHDHYDHFDMESVLVLAERGVLFLVPVGLGAHLEAWGLSSDVFRELSWGDETLVRDVRIVSTPARHFSGRSGFDRFATLWTGWAVIGPRHRAAFTGDSGMGAHFARTGAEYGPFDLTMPEVGSYDRAWPDVHLGPEQALLAHRDLRGKVLLPVHWAAFVMGNHGWTEPGERLLTAATDEDGLILPRPGQRVLLSSDSRNFPTSRWWPEVPFRTAQDSPIQSTGFSK